MLVLGVSNKIHAKNPHKQQSNIPLALPEGQELVFLFVSVDNDREKKREEKQQKEKKETRCTWVSFNFAIMQPGTYSLVCHHGEFFVQSDQWAHYQVHGTTIGPTVGTYH